MLLHKQKPVQQSLTKLLLLFSLIFIALLMAVSVNGALGDGIELNDSDRWANNSIVIYHFNNDTIYNETSSMIYDFSAINSSLGILTRHNLSILTGDAKFGSNYKVIGAGSYSFDGSANAKAPKDLPMVQSYTYALWVRPNSTTNDQYLTGGLNMPNLLVGYQDGFFNLYMGGYPCGGNAVNSQVTAVANEWQHLVYISDGTNTLGYRNGTLEINCSGVKNFAGGTRDLFLGSSATPAGYFTGFMDEFAFWNRSLNRTEVQEIYNCTSGIGGCPASAALPDNVHVPNINVNHNLSYTMWDAVGTTINRTFYWHINDTNQSETLDTNVSYSIDNGATWEQVMIHTGQVPGTNFSYNLQNANATLYNMSFCVNDSANETCAYSWFELMPDNLHTPVVINKSGYRPWLNTTISNTSIEFKVMFNNTNQSESMIANVSLSINNTAYEERWSNASNMEFQYNLTLNGLNNSEYWIRSCVFDTSLNTSCYTYNFSIFVSPADNVHVPNATLFRPLNGTNFTGNTSITFFFNVTNKNASENTTWGLFVQQGFNYTGTFKLSQYSSTIGNASIAITLNGTNVSEYLWFVHVNDSSLNSTNTTFIYYFNISSGSGACVLTGQQAAWLEEAGKTGEKMIVAALILLPLLFGFLLMVGAITLSQQHAPMKIALFLLSIITFWSSLHIGVLAVMEYTTNAAFQTFIANIARWTGYIFFIILAYFIIYTFYSAITHIAEKRKERLQY